MYILKVGIIFSLCTVVFNDNNIIETQMIVGYLKLIINSIRFKISDEEFYRL